jgi:diguanylate cyclase (GGDEF)-like protein
MVKALQNNNEYIAIGEAHQQMHTFATQLLVNLNTKQPITTTEYDHFSNSLERLQLEIYTLKNEIESILYSHDPLTMTINRVSMLPLLREQQELSKRETQSCCLSMVDLDFFKKVNDTHGHIIGDKVLAGVARYLLENLRPYDRVFRYGGEEFLLCFPHVNVLQAYDMMDRLRIGIAEKPLDVGLPEPLYITISCGVTLLDPSAPIEKSIENADKAMYFAKSKGRNRTEMSSMM